MHTVGPTTDPPPDHGVPQCAFYNVVRRRNSLDACESPQTVFYLEELVACGRRFRALAPRPFQKGLLDFPTQAVHPLLKHIPRQSPVAHPVPVTEQSVRQRKQPRSRSLAATTSVDHRLEVSAQMRPASLTPECLDPLIRAKPITADDLIVFAPQERCGDFAATTFGDGKDRAKSGHRGPQPSLAAVLAPRCLVDINRLGLMDRSRELVVRGFKGDGRLPFQLGNHSGGDRQSKQVAYHLLDLTITEAIGAREHGQHGLKVRAEASRGDARWQGSAGRLAAARAGQTVEPILIDDWLDLGQFGDLMDQGGGVIAAEFMTASAASSRLTVGRLANVLGRDQGTVSLTMSGLPTSLLSAGRSRRLALHSDRIGRRGLRRVRGVELETILEIIDTRFKLGKALFVELDERKNRRLDFWRSRVPHRFGDRGRPCHAGRIIMSFANDNPRL